MVRLKVCIPTFHFFEVSYFNSSMVRLKVSSFANSAKTSEFQFQYGAIKSTYVVEFFKQLNIFQFQYGAIKRKFTNPIRCRSTRFQFQYGAIKSVTFLTSSFLNQLFQFQYGAIKRQQNNAYAIMDINFNSSMVRLKENSAYKRVSADSFQFQYGAIKRYNKILKECGVFISIPVWCD